MPRPAIDMSGQTINGRLVLGRAEPAAGNAYWNTTCLTCGRESRVSGVYLRQGRGCARCAQTGERNANWMGDAVGYSGAHRRLSALLGPATAQSCADCGDPAEHWSYVETTGYSTDPDDYTPRCVSCHRIYDRRQAA